MSKSAARPPATQAYTQRLRRGTREGVLLGAGAITIYLLMALVSYVPTDPGWSARGGDVVIHNLGGVTGAWLADVLLSLFGWPAYLLPWTILFSGWLAYRGTDVQTAMTTAVRATAIIVALFALCALFAAWGGSAAQLLPQSDGGILGSLLAAAAEAALGRAGSQWFLMVLCGVGLSIGLGFSWLVVAEYLGGGCVWLWHKLQPAFGRVRQRVQRPAGADEAGEKSGLRVLPRIGAAQPAKATVSNGRSAPSLNDDEVVEAATASSFLNSLGRKKPESKRSEPVLEPAPAAASRRANNKGPSLDVPRYKPGTAVLPAADLLDLPKLGGKAYSDEELTQLSSQLVDNLADFGVNVSVKGALPGPVVTRFEVEPAPGVKVSQISNLAKDLARSLSVMRVRVVDVIPGKSYVGLELPNTQRELVALRQIIDSDAFARSSGVLTLALGKDIGGQPVVADLARMPHLLVAGTTGSGKSVAINVMILSLLFRLTPEDVRLIMIDPKMLELSVYEGIPHLLAPVVTDMKEAANALRWCVAEMERRYRTMAAVGVRNLAGFNRKVEDAIEAGQPIPDPLYKPEEAFDPDEPPPTLAPEPHIVVIVDELADMMMVVGKKVEELIARLAQKARAAGIHLILATQRPSVDVITGLIKANIPTRIAFQVSSRIDSRTILDQMGAESLLGNGDMLYLPPGTAVPRRVHGAFVDDHEVHKVVAWLRQTGNAQYDESILSGEGVNDAPGAAGAGGDDAEADPLYDEAVKVVIETRKASISGVQRRLRIGYNRAARMVEQMEAAGVVGPLESNGSREVLVPAPQES